MTYPSSRKIGDLSARMKSLYYRFDIAMKSTGIDHVVTCTYRNNADQDALYALGRTVKGSIVTNAKAGESIHNKTDDAGFPASDAFDIVIIKNGKPDWDVKNPAWKTAGAIGTKLGLEWAGNWKTFKEFPHFQLPQTK